MHNPVNPSVLIPFDPEMGLDFVQWIQYFEKEIEKFNVNDDWKFQNFKLFLRGSAITYFINHCLDCQKFSEIIERFLEHFLPLNVNLEDFQNIQFSGKKSELPNFFKTKMEIGHKVQLDPKHIMDSMTDQLSCLFKKYVYCKDPKSPLEWFHFVTKLFQHEINSNGRESNNAARGTPDSKETSYQQKSQDPSKHRFPRKIHKLDVYQKENNSWRYPKKEKRYRTKYFFNSTSKKVEEKNEKINYQLLIPGYIQSNFVKKNTKDELGIKKEKINKRDSALLNCIYFNADTGSSLNILPSGLLSQYQIPCIEEETLLVRQTQGTIQLSQKCNLEIRIGNVVKTVEFFILNTDLPYAILGLKSCIDFRLEINCVKGVVTQGGRSLINFSNPSDDNQSLHILPESFPVSCLSKKNRNEGDKCAHKQSQTQSKRSLSVSDKKCQNDDELKEKNKKEVEKVNKNGSNRIGKNKKKKSRTQKIKKECPEKVNFGSSDNGDGVLHFHDQDDHQYKLQDPNLKEILNQYEEIFAKNKYDVGLIRIEPQRVRLTSDLPITLRPYKTSPKQQEEIDRQIRELLQIGIIKESNSPYSAPVTLVFKKDEQQKSRLCIDFRKLNVVTKADAEPLPLIETLIDKLSQSKYFSKLDMASGYWHIPIHPEDAEKLAFATNSGLYEWHRLPFGWRNAPSIFQRTIRRILTKHKIKFAANYFDDIIIFSNSYEEHLQHLKQIFEICSLENLKLKKSKCSFLNKTINFLGYEISNGMVTPDNHNIEAIANLKPPTNVKSLQRFLGSINVYHKFINQYAHVRYPLNQLLKKNVPWNWTDKCQEAFEILKQSVMSKPILQIFNSKKECHVFVDASQTGVGAVLKQPNVDGTLMPVAFHSRSLRDYEKNYAITELECLAIVDALNKFHHYLFGQKFTIHTDHAALVWLKNVKNLKGRLFRWSLQLSMYDYDIKYTKGTTNIEADMLSRNIEVDNNCHNLVYENNKSLFKQVSHLLKEEEIIEAQNKDNLIGKYVEINNVKCMRRKGYIKVVIPFSLRLKLLELVHSTFGHPGIQKTIKLIAPVYYWPHINSDISNFIKHCHVCQINKKPRQKRFGLLHTMPPVEKPFELLAIDSVGGFNYYNSTKKYLTLVIDHHTRYIWSFASKAITSEAYAGFLKQIFQIQTPKAILSDRNAAFTSSSFKKFLRAQKIKQLLTTAHRPETNGKVERINQTIVTRLKCKVNEKPTKLPWPKYLEQVTQEYNATPHAVTGFPPAYLMYGTIPFPHPINQNIYPPLEEARKIAVEKTKLYHLKNKVYYDARFVDIQFNVGDTVIYEEFKYPNSRKLNPVFSGPYQITEKMSEVNYKINRPQYHSKENNEIVHVSKLRRYFPPKDLRLSHE